MRLLSIEVHAFISALVNIIINLEVQVATGVKAPYRTQRVYLVWKIEWGGRGV